MNQGRGRVRAATPLSLCRGCAHRACGVGQALGCRGVARVRQSARGRPVRERPVRGRIPACRGSRGRRAKAAQRLKEAVEDRVAPPRVLGQQAHGRLLVEPVPHGQHGRGNHRVPHVREDHAVPVARDALAGLPRAGFARLHQAEGQPQAAVQGAVLVEGGGQELASRTRRGRREPVEVFAGELLAAGHGGVHEGLTVGEVVEQPALGDSGLGGHGVQGGGALALREHQVLEGGQQLVSGFRFAGHGRAGPHVVTGIIADLTRLTVPSGR
ncbi:hypothetical protein ACUW97_002161 [Kocuria rhizophila]